MLRYFLLREMKSYNFHLILLLCLSVIHIHAAVVSVPCHDSYFSKIMSKKKRKKARSFSGLTSGIIDEIKGSESRSIFQAMLLVPTRNSLVLIMAGATIFIHKMIRSEAVHRACYFWLNAGPVVAHYKFTKYWLSKTNAPLEKRERVYQNLHNRYASHCFDIVLQLQGLYIKIGQIISSRPDFVPPQYIDLFGTAQDSMPQLPVEEVEEIIAGCLRKELGLSFQDVFEYIDPVALGSASIGQCHQAILKEPYTKLNGYNGGKDVAVKVMHPRYWMKKTGLGY